MGNSKFILGKRILIVDDEQDILEILIELLSLCKIDTASTFEEGRRLLKSRNYDLVILDIMGVRGFELLDIARDRGVPALMLTAHALTEESLSRSIEKGAAYFVPKEEMAQISTYVSDILEAKEKKENPWVRWFKRLADSLDVAFTGPDWREQQKEFLEKLKNSKW
ncbi:MAG: response regulator [Desulfobacteraceae bacterium]|nr:MAG: response regulator [Desulfobacteraceae bacterium]